MSESSGMVFKRNEEDITKASITELTKSEKADLIDAVDVFTINGITDWKKVTYAMHEYYVLPPEMWRERYNRHVLNKQ